ncbi:hypothetical protein AB1N83_013670 [Pleurotus pulmonarius]
MAGAELANPRPHPYTSLPTELIIKILGIVGTYWHGIKSPLADCALVSRTWNTLCRPHMFYTVTLYSNTVLKRLSFLHFQAAHLCKYIRAVYFRADAAEIIVAKAEWFPECFARLTNLHKLRLFSCANGPLPAASLAAFAAPQLRRLLIDGWQFAGVYDLLSLFPPSLEELQLESIKFDRSPNNVTSRALELKAPRIPGIRLEALRNLEIHHGFESIFATPHLIECPNLACLFVICWQKGPTHLPPWLPTSLPELVLSSGPDSAIPHFGALRPVLVTLSICSYDATPYLDFFTWARDCINRLPDPRAIRALTIDISGYRPPRGTLPRTLRLRDVLSIPLLPPGK